MPIAVLRTVSAEFRTESILLFIITTVRSSSDPLVSFCEQFGRSTFNALVPRVGNETYMLFQKWSEQ